MKKIGVILISLLMSQCKVQSMKEPDYSKILADIRTYTQATVDFEPDVILNYIDSSVVNNFGESFIKDKFDKKNRRPYNASIIIKSITPYGGQFEFENKIYVFLEGLSDSDTSPSMEKMIDHKFYTFITSNLEGKVWKFLPENYYLGYGQTENGVGFINEHPEVLPQEVWDHFYRKLDPKKYK